MIRETGKISQETEQIDNMDMEKKSKKKKTHENFARNPKDARAADWARCPPTKTDNNARASVVKRKRNHTAYSSNIAAAAAKYESRSECDYAAAAVPNNGLSDGRSAIINTRESGEEQCGGGRVPVTKSPPPPRPRYGVWGPRARRPIFRDNDETVRTAKRRTFTVVVVENDDGGARARIKRRAEIKEKVGVMIKPRNAIIGRTHYHVFVFFHQSIIC